MSLSVPLFLSKKALPSGLEDKKEDSSAADAEADRLMCFPTNNTAACTIVLVLTGAWKGS